MSEPRPIHITKAEDVKTADGQTEGMIRQSAIVDISPSLCGLLMRAEPHATSAIHHHGAQDTIIYAVSGRGTLVSEGGTKRQVLNPGDWAMIPAGREHQEVNDSEEEVVLAIVRAPGGVPEVVNLEGWGGKKTEG